MHVSRGGGKAKFWLSPVKLVRSRGLTTPELRRAHELTEAHAAEFLERWTAYFHR